MKVFQYFSLLIVFTTSFSSSFCQDDELSLTNDQKAFIYHVIWKDKRLKAQLGDYIEYVGEPYFKRDGKSPKRDSIEISIKANGDHLLIRRNDLAKVSKGMLMELCNKLALHELVLIFKHRNSEEPSAEVYKEKYEKLVEVFTKKLPAIAVSERKGAPRPLLKLEKILAPTYSTRSKINVVSSGGAFDATETKLIVNAINSTIETWVAKKALQYFEYFGNRTSYLSNKLISAGDGGGYSGAGKERKQDDWYKGLTHPIGFFYYQNEPKKNAKSGKMSLKSNHVPVIEYNTHGNDTITTIHFDVWGQSQERQTTVVIQKGMYSYILYGKDETALLSPDSAYGEEGVTTYQMLIDELTNVHIAHYDEMIYGKEGYDFQIEYHGKQIDICLKKIKQTEYKLNAIRYSSGSGNVTNYKPKKPKKVDPTGNSSVNKKKKTTQNELMYWYEKHAFHKGMVIKLKKEKQIALEILATLQDKLSEMNKNLGYKILKYELEDGIYMFEDSATFNYETQDFKFNKDPYQEEYNIRILSFDEKVLSSSADEVVMHWSVMEEDEDEKLAFNIKMEDVYGADSYKIGKSLITDADSVKIKELIAELNYNSKNIEVELFANGLGRTESNGKLKKQIQPTYFEEYPTAKEEEYSKLRTSTIKIDLGSSLIIKIASYTDGKTTNFKPLNKKVISFMAKNPSITKNEIITAYRSVALINQLANEVLAYGQKYTELEESKKAANFLLKQIKKAKIKIGNKMVKGSLFVE